MSRTLSSSSQPLVSPMTTLRLAYTIALPITPGRRRGGDSGSSPAQARACVSKIPRLWARSEEHTSELQSRQYLVCRLLLEKKKTSNMLATRLYRCPIVYCEHYVMNSKDTFERIQADTYQGKRNLNGSERQRIFRQDVDSVV